METVKARFYIEELFYGCRSNCPSTACGRACESICAQLPLQLLGVTHQLLQTAFCLGCKSKLNQQGF